MVSERAFFFFVFLKKKNCLKKKKIFFLYGFFWWLFVRHKPAVKVTPWYVGPTARIRGVTVMCRPPGGVHTCHTPMRCHATPPNSGKKKPPCLVVFQPRSLFFGPNVGWETRIRGLRTMRGHTRGCTRAHFSAAQPTFSNPKTTEAFVAVGKTTHRGLPAYLAPV